MGVHGSDIDHWSESVPVMSILHQTYRVTHLRVIHLLRSRQGVWEKVTGKVSETTEKFRRENTRIVSVKLKSCFRVYHYVKLVSAQAWKFLEGTRIVLGTSEIFRRKNLEMLRSCRNRFSCFSQMKIINPELFRNASKIILGGAGNVPGLQEFFRIKQTMEILLWIVENTIGRKYLMNSRNTIMNSGNPIMNSVKIYEGILVFYHLFSPINRGEGCSPISSKFSLEFSYTCHRLVWLLSPSQRNSFVEPKGCLGFGRN